MATSKILQRQLFHGHSGNEWIQYGFATSATLLAWIVKLYKYANRKK